MLRSVTWRAWAVPGILFAVYIVLGLTWTPSGSTEEWTYKIGALGATFAPLLLIAIYGASGNKFWLNDVGSALVQLALSIPIIAGPLAWSAWLDHGSITAGMVAWLEIAGPVLVTLAILRLCYVFLRVHRDGNSGEGALPLVRPRDGGHPHRRARPRGHRSWPGCLGAVHRRRAGVPGPRHHLPLRPPP